MSFCPPDIKRSAAAIIAVATTVAMRGVRVSKVGTIIATRPTTAATQPTIGHGPDSSRAACFSHSTLDPSAHFAIEPASTMVTPA